MDLTEIILFALIVSMLGWALYVEVAPERRRGRTRLTVPLLRRSPADTAIFTALLAILVYNNLVNHGSLLTTWLLCGTALLAIYTGWLRTPWLRFKTGGFFYGPLWISYSRVREMNLSEDGVLVVQLEKRRLLIRVRNIDDLEEVYKIMLHDQ
ncbi:DUF986 family protein [Erwinia sp. CPCC 100877]|nr:DUF986 family protein [Erwinia sp. CPCC 100877]